MIYRPMRSMTWQWGLFWAVGLFAAPGVLLAAEGDLQREVVIPADSDAPGPYRHPSMFDELDNGDLYAVYYGGAGSTKGIRLFMGSASLAEVTVGRGRKSLPIRRASLKGTRWSGKGRTARSGCSI